MTKSALALALLTTLACSEQKKVGFDTVESARLQAHDNAQINANAFRNSYAPADVVRMRGDSSITPECPQGDGWATIDLVNKENIRTKTMELKCSTVSAAIGCMPTEDFQKRKEFSSQDGQCNTEIPFPLPKIGK